MGGLARTIGSLNGIDQFFNRASDLAIKHDKEIGVSDIANGPKYGLYQGGLRGIPGPLLMGASTSGIGSLLGACGLAYGNAMSIQELLNVGVFDLERKKFEKFIIDMEDARRLLTAKGIQQEAERRIQGSQLTYISPRAHVSRVKWYLEHPTDVITNIKGKVYSLAVGLPKSTRIYKNSEMFHSWQLVSDIPIKV